MAVTVSDIAVAIRLSVDGTDLETPQTTILQRLLDVGTAHVDMLIPDAPTAIRDECVVRLAAYIYDQPMGRRDSHSNSWVNSGAASLATRWQTQRIAGAT